MGDKITVEEYQEELKQELMNLLKELVYKNEYEINSSVEISREDHKLNISIEIVS